MGAVKSYYCDIDSVYWSRCYCVVDKVERLKMLKEAGYTKKGKKAKEKEK